MKRRAGSVRFDPYYKLQWWEPRSLAWRDVQHSFSSLPDAVREALSVAEPAERWRVMEVTEKGRQPVVDSGE